MVNFYKNFEKILKKGTWKSKSKSWTARCLWTGLRSGSGRIKAACRQKKVAFSASASMCAWRGFALERLQAPSDLPGTVSVHFSSNLLSTCNLMTTICYSRVPLLRWRKITTKNLVWRYSKSLIITLLSNLSKSNHRFWISGSWRPIQRHGNLKSVGHVATR